MAIDRAISFKKLMSRAESRKRFNDDRKSRSKMAMNLDYKLAALLCHGMQLDYPFNNMDDACFYFERLRRWNMQGQVDVAEQGRM